MADERHDAASQYGEVNAAISEEMTQAAVSRLRASELGAPQEWPRHLGWFVTNFGLLIETEHGQHLLQPDAPIGGADILRRLIHPGFAAGLVGSC